MEVAKIEADSLIVIGTVAGAVSTLIAISAVLIGAGRFIGGYGNLR